MENRIDVDVRRFEVCGLCDGTGYVEGPTTTGTHVGEPITYTSVVNCRCSVGQRRWDAGTIEPEQGELLT